MAEFTPITTQEQLDAVIGERLRRERETLAKKYEDHDDLVRKVSDYEQQIGQLNETIRVNGEKYAGYDKTLAELNGRLKGYETASVKTRIALETGLPYGMAERLAGETEADIRADAKNLLQLMGSRADPAPLASTEPAEKDGRRSALRALNAQLTTNE